MKQNNSWLYQEKIFNKHHFKLQFHFDLKMTFVMKNTSILTLAVSCMIMTPVYLRLKWHHIKEDLLRVVKRKAEDICKEIPFPPLFTKMTYQQDKFPVKRFSSPGINTSSTISCISWKVIRIKLSQTINRCVPRAWFIDINGSKIGWNSRKNTEHPKGD